MIEFRSFGKIPRLFRDIVITEKLDGTNAAIGINFYSVELPLDYQLPDHDIDVTKFVDRGGREVNGMVNYAVVYAQSRKRVITPQKDNHGFARWVYENAETLIEDLGPGLHFGEWWGSGINRGYGLEKGHKVFSLFNVKRWNDEAKLRFTTPNLDVVPVLYRGPFDTGVIRVELDKLESFGSSAAPGFDRPEGIVIYHTAANELFKVTIENDAQPKSLVA